MHVMTLKNVQYMSQYHKAIFIQNSLGKISSRTYWRQSYYICLIRRSPWFRRANCRIQVGYIHFAVFYEHLAVCGKQ